MSQNEKKNNGAIGLDVGTSRIVAARQGEQELQFETQLNAFVNIPHSKLTEGVLRKERVPHTVEGSHIVVHGNESERFADLLDSEIRRPMSGGLLNPGEPDSLKMIREITATVTGKPAQKGQRLCFTVPAAPLGAEDTLTYHETTLRQLLAETGFDVKSVNEGLAVVYGELDSSNFTGIGVSCGGGLCNVSLAYLSVPVMSFSIPKAGDFIDASAAAMTGERANRIRMVKEDSFYLNGHFNDKLHQVLGVYYDDMIQTLVTGMKDAFSGIRRMPKFSRPLPLVLAGGTALPGGFRDRFEKALRESDFPLPLSEIRLAADPLTATAKGALVAAMCDM
jgi:hypothetical protein